MLINNPNIFLSISKYFGIGNHDITLVFKNLHDKLQYTIYTAKLQFFNQFSNRMIGKYFAFIIYVDQQSRHMNIFWN